MSMRGERGQNIVLIIFKKQIYEIKLGVPPKNQFSMDKYDMNTTSLGERIGGAGDLENKANSI